MSEHQAIQQDDVQPSRLRKAAAMAHTAVTRPGEIAGKVGDWMKARYGVKGSAAAMAIGQLSTWAATPFTMATLGMPLPPGTGLLTSLAAAEVIRLLRRSQDVEADRKQWEEDERKRIAALDRLRALPQYPTHMAGGGEVPSAPGIPRGADTVPIRAQAGEVVVRNGPAQTYRTQLDAMNAGRTPAFTPRASLPRPTSPPPPQRAPTPPPSPAAGGDATNRHQSDLEKALESMRREASAKADSFHSQGNHYESDWYSRMAAIHAAEIGRVRSLPVAKHAPPLPTPAPTPTALPQPTVSPQLPSPSPAAGGGAPPQPPPPSTPAGALVPVPRGSVPAVIPPASNVPAAIPRRRLKIKAEDIRDTLKDVNRMVDKLPPRSPSMFSWAANPDFQQKLYGSVSVRPSPPSKALLPSLTSGPQGQAAMLAMSTLFPKSKPLMKLLGGRGGGGYRGDSGLPFPTGGGGGGGSSGGGSSLGDLATLAASAFPQTRPFAPIIGAAVGSMAGNGSPQGDGDSGDLQKDLVRVLRELVDELKKRDGKGGGLDPVTGAFTPTLGQAGRVLNGSDIGAILRNSGR